MSALIADTDSLSSVIANHNAIDYLVRSTSFVSAVCGNAQAMSYIGGNNYASNTLLDNSSWRTGISNSSYYTSVLNFTKAINGRITYNGSSWSGCPINGNFGATVKLCKYTAQIGSNSFDSDIYFAFQYYSGGYTTLCTLHSSPYLPSGQTQSGLINSVPSTSMRIDKYSFSAGDSSQGTAYGYLTVWGRVDV